MFTFHKKYFFLFLILLLIEISIAKYAVGFMRHTFGDFLAVILVYALLKSVVNISTLKANCFSLCITFGIEFLQLSNLQNYFPEKYAYYCKLVLGTSFSFLDLLAYTLGVISVIFIENRLNN